MFYAAHQGMESGWQPGPLLPSIPPFPDVISVAMEFRSAPFGGCSHRYLHVCLNDLMKCIQTFIEMIARLLVVCSTLSKIQTSGKAWALSLESYNQL